MAASGGVRPWRPCLAFSGSLGGCTLYVLKLPLPRLVPALRQGLFPPCQGLHAQAGGLDAERWLAGSLFNLRAALDLGRSRTVWVAHGENKWAGSVFIDAAVDVVFSQILDPARHECATYQFFYHGYPLGEMTIAP